MLDACDDSVIVYAEDGRITRTNRVGRERLLAGWGVLPTTMGEMAAAVALTKNDGTPLDRLPGQEALEGRPASALLGYTDAEGRVRRFSVHATPVRDASNRIRGAVAIWHDVTELQEASIVVGQLDGALKTVRRVLHEMGNALAPARGYSELLPAAKPEIAAAYVAEIVESLDRGLTILGRLGQVTRFEQSTFGGETMLDLEMSASEDSSPPP